MQSPAQQLPGGRPAWALSEHSHSDFVLLSPLPFQPQKLLSLGGANSRYQMAGRRRSYVMEHSSTATLSRTILVIPASEKAPILVPKLVPGCLLITSSWKH